MVNVPSGVLIDEEGTIVRWDEGTYSREFQAGTMTIGTNLYRPIVEDWVAKGSDSPYLQTPEQLSHWLRRRSSPEARADAYFRLASYHFEAGNQEAAERYWAEAQALNPDSWNYHRQDWSFTPAEANRNWFQKVQTLGDKPYYAPIELPEGVSPPEDAADGDN